MVLTTDMHCLVKYLQFPSEDLFVWTFASFQPKSYYCEFKNVMSVASEIKLHANI